MSDVISAEDKELLRHAVLEELAARYPAALPIRGVARKVQVTLAFEPELTEVSGALEFLTEKGLARSTWDELGSSKWYAATAAGVQVVERGL